MGLVRKKSSPAHTSSGEVKGREEWGLFLSASGLKADSEPAQCFSYLCIQAGHEQI